MFVSFIRRTFLRYRGLHNYTHCYRALTLALVRLSCKLLAVAEMVMAPNLLNPTQPYLVLTQPNPTQPIRHYRYTEFCYESKTQVNVNYIYSIEQTIRQHVMREYYETAILILSHQFSVHKVLS